MRIFLPLLALVLLVVGITFYLSEEASSRFAFVVRVQNDGVIAVSKWPNAEKEDSLVRMYGITMLSQRQPFGGQAFQFLQGYLPKGAKIEVQKVGKTGQDGVEEVLLQVKGHSLNYALIEEGYAWVDRKSCTNSYCRRWYIVEHRAVEEKRGVWSLKMDTPPWQWAR